MVTTEGHSGYSQATGNPNYPPPRDRSTGALPLLTMKELPMQQAKPTTARFYMYCPACHAKLWASRQLLGHRCHCPRCKHQVVVAMKFPSDADIALVPGKDERSLVPANSA